MSIIEIQLKYCTDMIFLCYIFSFIRWHICRCKSKSYNRNKFGFYDPEAFKCSVFVWERQRESKMSKQTDAPLMSFWYSNKFWQTFSLALEQPNIPWVECFQIGNDSCVDRKCFLMFPARKEGWFTSGHIPNRCSFIQMCTWEEGRVKAVSSQ